MKTSAGLSDVRTLKNIICQGDSWGSMECGVMVDGFGKQSLNPELEPYQYKGKVPVPLLGMVDDTLMVLESGYKTQRLNAFLNAKTACKRLQFGMDKCFVMHVGKNISEYKKVELYVDGWKKQEMQNILTGETKLKETHEGEHDVLERFSEKYLVQLLSSDGSNVKNVENRANKGIGMAGTMQSILTNVPGGKFHFEIAVMMRNAYLI